ncbi:outer membrane protein assembly factor BamE [Elstera sp.]|jgi:outer membrane protein assembly factor BamE (lipoprotein component of BamABCDE complex)|uniref:outer membrane protein assembly factor BamE n=1 Tax=Elstera sp. TaxID=1916664 RepID=UPI0037BF93E8
MMTTNRTPTRRPTLGLTLGLTLFVLGSGLGACTPIVDNRGNLPTQEAVDQIIIGGSSRADVQRLLGSPTAAGTFSDKVWYYISRKQETIAFLKPAPVEQTILRVYFDDAGLVSKLAATGGETVEFIDHTAETTPTTGHSMGFIEQLFGNIGRFGSKDGPYKAPSPTGQR